MVARCQLRLGPEAAGIHTENDNRQGSSNYATDYLETRHSSLEKYCIDGNGCDGRRSLE